MMSIETERTILRMVSKDDINNIFSLLSNEKIIENLNMEIHKNVSDTEKLVEDYLKGYEKKEKYPFAIIDKETNNFIGVFLVKLDLYDEDCFEYTVYINEKFWGKGICTEILQYMENFVFEEINVGNFRGFIMEKNEASEKVLKKCGFSLEKIFSVQGIDGKIKSYLKTRDDYTSKKA